MVSYEIAGSGKRYAHGEGNDWHRSAKQALERAEDMRKKKIASLRKSIAKLEAMNFDEDGLGSANGWPVDKALTKGASRCA